MHRMSRLLPFLIAVLAWRLLAEQPVVLILVLAVGGLALLGYRSWSRRRDERARAQRSEIVGRRLGDAARERFPAVADRILDLEDRVGLSGSSMAREHFRAATEAFITADERMTDAASAAEFIDVLDRLDDAGWHLDAVDAVLDGRPVPERSPIPATVPDSSSRARASLERWGSPSRRDSRHRHRRHSC